MYLLVARQRVQTLKKLIDGSSAGAMREGQAARQRAARAREERIEAAPQRLPELAEFKQRQGDPPDRTRTSKTDAEAKVMKIGDGGGFRLPYNVQYGIDAESQIIVRVTVVRSGGDQGQTVPMVEQVAGRGGRTPDAWLVDGGPSAHEQIGAVSERTAVLARMPQSKNEETDADRPRAAESPAVADWRKRMATDEAKQRYGDRDRPATAECVNVLARTCGLIRLPVRGLAEVRAAAVLFALAHNLMRVLRLALRLTGIGKGTSAIPAMVV